MGESSVAIAGEKNQWSDLQAACLPCDPIPVGSCCVVMGSGTAALLRTAACYQGPHVPSTAVIILAIITIFACFCKNTGQPGTQHAASGTGSFEGFVNPSFGVLWAGAVCMRLSRCIHLQLCFLWL